MMRVVIYTLAGFIFGIIVSVAWGFAGVRGYTTFGGSDAGFIVLFAIPFIFAMLAAIAANVINKRHG